MITDEMLTKAAEEANHILLDSLPDANECNYTFSPKFERKMKRVTRKANHPTMYRFLKQIAGFLLIILIGASSILAFNTEARNKIWGWAIVQYENYVSYRFKAGTNTENIYTDYYISELPAGYIESERIEDETFTIINYANKEGYILSLMYSTTSDKPPVYVSLDDVKQESIPFKEFEADIYIALKPEDDSAIIWIDPDTNIFFCLDGYFPADQLIKIAESVVPSS